MTRGKCGPGASLATSNVFIFSLSIQQTGAGSSRSPSPLWFTRGISGQPGLHREKNKTRTPEASRMAAAGSPPFLFGEGIHLAHRSACQSQTAADCRQANGQSSCPIPDFPGFLRRLMHVR